MNYLRYDDEGGHAKVEAGISLGIELPKWKNSWSNISSRLGLLVGSRLRIDVINDLA